MSERDYEFDEHENSTRWFVGIIVALALLAIGYLVFSAENCHTDICSAAIEASE